MPDHPAAAATHKYGDGHHPRRASWDTFVWPAWVPAEVRKAVMDFWGPHQGGRGPGDWQENSCPTCSPYNYAPAFGEHVSLLIGGTRGDIATGRYVHCWNNIGRIVRDDGSFAYVSTSRPTLAHFARHAALQYEGLGHG